MEDSANSAPIPTSEVKTPRSGKRVFSLAYKRHILAELERIRNIKPLWPQRSALLGVLSTWGGEGEGRRPTGCPRNRHPSASLAVCGGGRSAQNW